MELRILEVCAAVFLLLPLLRPFFKSLWALNGLVILPLLSLGIITGLFPAYGFRPECIPFLAFALVYNILNFGAFVSLFSNLKNDDYRDRGPVWTLCCLVIFGFTVWTVHAFSPPLDNELDGTVQTMVLRNQDTELWLRIYISQEPDSVPAQAFSRPLLLLVPPVAGSVAVTDAVCVSLRDKGWAVLSYSRPGFDSPAIDETGSARRLMLPELYRLFCALAWGQTTAEANAWGRSLEDGRKHDIEYILGELDRNKTLQDKLSGAGRNCLFLAGYGAAGAALTALAASPEWASKVRGFIALESPLLSGVGRETEEPSGFPGIFLPQRVSRGGNLPALLVPAMFIVSGRAEEEKTDERGGRYQTIFNAAKSSRAPALVASLAGAGPFDYSDSPRLYPVYSFLFRGAGKDPRRESSEFPAITASIITNFAVRILDSQAAGEDAGPEPAARRTGDALKKTALEGFNLETAGLWNLGDSRGILQP